MRLVMDVARASYARTRADRAIMLIAVTCVALLIGGLFFHALNVKGAPHNSYGALAHSFLHGRLDVDKCPEADCAIFNGHTYIIFPPAPALAALPFVAIFGSGFKYFGALAIGFASGALVLWWNILVALNLGRSQRTWLLTAIACASPVFGVTFGGGNVWFFAQIVSFFLLTASLWAIICRRTLILAAVFLGCAFLCRQMNLLWFPALLALEAREQVSRELLSWRLAARIAAAGSVMIVFVSIYWFYNWARFDNILETGYRFIVPSNNFLGVRLARTGLFSHSYVLQNAIYLLFSGPHVDFAGPQYLNVRGLDSLGTSLPAASPWVLLALYIRLDRTAMILAGTIAIIVVTTLFYHGDGFEQVNMQRFTLDWLPLLLVLMARSPKRPAYAAMPLLVTWGVAINLCAFVIVLLFGMSVPK